MANFDRVATLYDTYRPSFEVLRAETLLEHSLDDGGGRTAVDLGTGTGVMAFVLAEHGYRVTGLDHSPRMLQQARKSAVSRRTEVDFRIGSADTGLDGASVDTVTASQSWHLFDGRRAFTECRRILKPGGTLLVTTYDWLPLPGSAARITEEVIREVNPDWRDHDGTGTHAGLVPVAAGFGFTSIRTHERRFEQRYALDDWIGRIRTSSSGGAGLGTAQRRVLENRLREKLSATFRDGDIVVAHVAWSMSARKAGASRPTPAHAMTGAAG